MASPTLILVATLWYLSAVCEGGVHQITYNEEDLLGKCSSTCERLPDRTDMFGCDRISNCRFNRKGWRRGLVNCNWCTCDCHTSNDLPQKEVIHQSKKVLNEDELWGTCKKTCSASGLQKTDAFGCSEIRDCEFHKKGYRSYFVRCNYCECNCVIKGYPYKYRLENVKFNIDLLVISEADSINVGKTTVENHSSREQGFTRSISTSIETSRMWQETSSSTLTVGATVSISDPIYNLVSLGMTTTKSKMSEYKWGETKTWTTTHATTQQVVVGPRCAMEATMLGTNYITTVPYTADLVTIYDCGMKTRKSISGTLHEVTVSDVHLVYGKCTPLPKKRSYELDLHKS